MCHSIFLALVLWPALQGIVDACGRTPGQPPSTSTTVSPVDETTEELSHRMPCTDKETFKQGCMNAGTCYALSLGGNRTTSCQCEKWYRGHRCQELSPDIFEQITAEEKVVTASIAAGVSVLVLLLTMGIIYAVVRVKRKRNRQETRLNGIPKNGHLLTPVNKFLSVEDEEESIPDDEKKQKLLCNNIHLLNDINSCNRETKV